MTIEQSALRKLEELEPGDHLCCLYRSEEEHRALLAPSMRRGLERGQKVLYIADAHTASTILAYLRAEGVDTSPFLERGQLSILTSNEAYTREGVFNPDRMLELLRGETERAVEEGYPALRVTGEMSWALKGIPGSERLIEYEASLNASFPAAAVWPFASTTAGPSPPASSWRSSPPSPGGGGGGPPLRELLLHPP